jgi:hypothetical protein
VDAAAARHGDALDLCLRHLREGPDLRRSLAASPSHAENRPPRAHVGPGGLAPRLQVCCPPVSCRKSDRSRGCPFGGHRKKTQAQCGFGEMPSQLSTELCTGHGDNKDLDLCIFVQRTNHCFIGAAPLMCAGAMHRSTPVWGAVHQPFHKEVSGNSCFACRGDAQPAALFRHRRILARLFLCPRTNERRTGCPGMLDGLAP